MTSPDKSVPAGAYTGTTGGNISALQSVTYESAHASVVATVMSSFAGVITSGATMNRATQQALQTATNAQSSAGNANSTANAAQGSTAANSTAINNLLAGQKAQDGGGSVFTDIFNRETLGPDYTTFKQGPVADLVITYGEVGLAQDGDEGTGFVLAVNNAKSTKTDDQSVSAVMGQDRNSDAAAAVLIARATSDLSSFVFATANRTSVAIGRATRTANGVTTTVWASRGAQVHTGDTLALNCVGTTYRLLVNGAAVISANDTGVTSPVGPANRYFGFGCQYNWSGLFWSFSFNIAGFTAADLAAPTVSGTGWSLQQTGSVSAPSGGLRFPANTFDTERVPTSNATVIDRGRGQVQVTKAGWYAISLAYNTTSPIVSPNGCELWWAPTTAGPWTVLRSGATQVSSEYNTAAAQTFTVYLAAGSLVCPGYSITSNATITGPDTYFDGAFISY